MKTTEQIADEIVERFRLKFPYTPKKSLVKCAIICVEEKIKTLNRISPCVNWTGAFDIDINEQKEVLTILKGRL